MNALKLFSICLILLFLTTLAVPAHAAPAAGPTGFGKLNPPIGSVQPANPTLRWEAFGFLIGTKYQYCLEDDKVLDCDAGWSAEQTGTSAVLSGLTNGREYLWQVRAVTGLGTLTYADNEEWWNFSVNTSVPASFSKVSPSNGNTNVPADAAVLSWGTTLPLTSYSYCIDTSNNSNCDTAWHPNGTDATITLDGLLLNTTYYWQVRANNTPYSLEANGGYWYRFTTRPALVVTNDDDTGDGSLRNTVAYAVAGDTVTFAESFNIYLNSEIIVDKRLTIDGEDHIIILSGDSNNDGLTTPNTNHLMVNVNGSLEVRHLRFVAGYKASYYGGAINNEGNLVVKNCEFLYNYSATGGGAIFIETGKTATISDSLFDHNSAEDHGGAITNGGTLTITRSTFSNNQVFDTTNGLGGALMNWFAFTIDDSTFDHNSAGSNGGAIHSNATTFASNFITNTTFFGNQAPEAGAIYQNDYFSGSITIKNSTIAGNEAYWSDHNASSPLAGGIYLNTGSMTFINTIVANNSHGNCIAFGLVDGGGNMNYGDGEASTLCPGIYADPLLNDLADNGGPVQTMAPALGSPAIDAASVTDCHLQDARGVVRPQGAHCDIGAVEVITISGNAGGSGVTLSYDDGGLVTTTSAGDGTYSFAIPFNWSGVVTPSRIGDRFFPGFRDYSDVVASLVDQDYILAYKVLLPLILR